MCDVECPELSLLYILQMLSREKKTLSQTVAPLKKYFHSGEKNFTVENKQEIINKIEKKYSAVGGAFGGKKAEEVSHLDGLWMKFYWGWFSVRASNTEPVLRLNVEAKTKDKMEAKVREISQIILEKFVRH